MAKASVKTKARKSWLAAIRHMHSLSTFCQISTQTPADCKVEAERLATRESRRKLSNMLKKSWKKWMHERRLGECVPSSRSAGNARRLRGTRNQEFVQRSLLHYWVRHAVSACDLFFLKNPLSIFMSTVGAHPADTEASEGRGSGGSLRTKQRLEQMSFGFT